MKQFLQWLRDVTRCVTLYLGDLQPVVPRPLTGTDLLIRAAVRADELGPKRKRARKSAPKKRGAKR